MSVLPKKGLCSKKSFIILCYRSEPGLNSPYLGLLKGQLNYWFSKKPNGFYKFLEPCNHPLYKAGDSWSEELGISRRVFNAVFDLIGIRYNSKTAFKKAKDKFQGKLYASYHDRKTHKMFFIRNAELHQQKEKTLPIKDTLKPKNIPQKKSISKEKTIHKSTNNSYSDNRSSNDTNCRSYGGTIGGKNINSFTENTSSSFVQEVQAKKKDDLSESKKIAEEVKNIWIEEIGEPGINHLSSTLITRINQSYLSVFDSSLEKWRIYCRQIASSHFLMGEKRGANFKARLSWAIKPETFERIQAGDFTLGDRKVEERPKEISLEEENKARDELKQELLNSSKDETWIEACLRLCEILGPKMVKNWLYPLNIITLNSTEVELQAPNRFVGNWVDKNLGKELKRTFQELLGSSLEYCRITAIA
ncbi:MAG: hypothetical protein BGO77_08005 [Caedibacter sp. 37-49]|nr:MAG: hypothetical protein BGO77_08005 [Caedibacter sp. 37-49]